MARIVGSRLARRIYVISGFTLPKIAPTLPIGSSTAWIERSE